MSSADIVNTTDASFDADVLKSNVPVVVDFWATWCQPCKAINPHLEALAAERRGALRVVKVNTEENMGIATQYGVRNLPTLLLFRDGKVVGQHVGSLNRSALDKFVAPVL